MIDVDISLSVGDGRRHFDLHASFRADVPIAALFGASGSGKSLTMQAIAGLLKPSQGHIRLDGRTLFDSSQGIDLPARERRIGYLFQDYALFPHLSVRDNVAFGLTNWLRRRPSAKEAASINGLLDAFGLSGLARSRIKTLSGGQQQRVALARALACEPQVLLLDEPFAALNPMLKASLRGELADVRRRWGIPMLMITHDTEDVLALADVAFVYHAGRVVREIDLHAGTSRSLVVEGLGGAPEIEDTPLRRQLRGMLEAPGHP